MDSEYIFIKATRENKELDIHLGKKMYIDLIDKIRDTYDIPIERARKKTVDTIQKAVKEYIDIDIKSQDIIFFDDQIHENILYYEPYIHKPTYIHLHPYVTSFDDKDLHHIFNLFESVLFEMFNKHKTMGFTFFELYHMVHYKPEVIEKKYIESSKKYKGLGVFIDDSMLILREMNLFFNKTHGGKRRTYKRKNKSKKNKLN
jgi:hypothetical protein